MKKNTKRTIWGLSAATLLVCGANSIVFAGSKSYSGSVSKYSDFESSTMKKSNDSDSGTNNSTTKPKGTFECWVETSTGSNATYKTAYSSNGTYYMNYKQNYDSPDTCAYNLYIGGYNLKLNISTALVNFTGGTVKGTWSPDTI